MENSAPAVREYPSFHGVRFLGSSLLNVRDFPWETLKSIRLSFSLSLSRFRPSDLSFPRDDDGGGEEGRGEIKLSVLVVSVDLSIGKQYRTVSNLIFRRLGAEG